MTKAFDEPEMPADAANLHARTPTWPAVFREDTLEAMFATPPYHVTAFLMYSENAI